MKARRKKRGWAEGDQEGGGQPPRWRVCRAARPGARHSPARPPGGAGRNARGAGRTGPAARPERVREGAGHPPAERRLPAGAQSWGGDSSASAGGGRDKQGGAREGGRPPSPGRRGHCRSAPAPRPAAAPAAPASRALLSPARPPRACGAWEVPGPPPSPGCSAARSPRSSPRPATSGGAGRAAPVL